MIGIRLKNFQERAVDFLINKTNNLNSRSKIVVESPTGSGKTIILLAFIEKYLDYNPNDIVCWLCPGKGDLEEQSKEKMNKFVPNIKNGSLFDILSNGFRDGTTYFINWETITKKDNNALKESERKNLFERIAEAHRQGKKFIIIIDEEHQNDTSKANDIISSINANYEIRVSATPKKRILGEFHQISELDVINEELITRFMYINKDLDAVSVSNPEHEAEILIEKADQIRKQIQLAYIKENENVRPLVLIQFPNLSDTLVEFVENKLNQMGYSYENKMVASWFSIDDKKFNSKKIGKINIGTTKQDSITNLDATPVFLLFKQALSTGWDCPRAKILIKLRENMSDTFEVQTLGRLRRMPRAKHYGNELLDCSYLYTFDEKYKLEVLKKGGAFETQRLFLKEEVKPLKLKKEFRNKDGTYADEKEIRNKIFDFYIKKYSLTKEYDKNLVILENNGFIINENLKRKYLEGKFLTLNNISDEQFNHKEFDIKINTDQHGKYLRRYIDSIKKVIGLSYEKTSELLKTLFLEVFGNEEYKILNLNKYWFYAFIINNEAIIREDLKTFASMKREQKFPLENKVEDFSIPLEEHFKYSSDEPNKRILNTNVYKEYNTAMITDDFRSRSERLFEYYCEKNNKVKYIYKNGDSGQQYLSIVYQDNSEKQRLFYPDYVVILNDNSIWLIETKGGELNDQSKNIDNQSENKFEAIKNFAQKHGYNFGFVRDKNDQLYLNNTQYTENMKDKNWKSIEKIF
ncbi:DEAD/DEAH box helicase [Mycoplasma sp. 3686d]|uniref:DEAD/DEAH box helicase n=1 Tax=Mycoplasma sp. 3686d TaxID=2967300 RepID=UPI00211C0733|nr:DEAD/DEAH box helicase family protein [Mycoplasma sp. 3686d]UUM24461.1 DEAD/DEAH box helicase family protein [Mycoplasma sp. 3686d]